MHKYFRETMSILVLYSILAVSNSQSIQVTTVEGIYEGYEASDGNYHTFYGIPYAMSMLGPDMFKPSNSTSVPTGLFYANDSSIECARPGLNGMIGIVDCLVLNVFTNNITTSKPVLVWLNGEESNPTISSHYSYKSLVDNEVVVVTLNYRLSIFGFLCLRTEQHPGNAGLKDIILGLEWIQKNIAAFGGDPDNVVLIGHGSAAAMAEIITLTPRSEGLVHKAVALSGSAIAPWAVSYDPIGAALTINSAMNGSLESIDDIATSLSSYSLNELYNILNKFKYTNNTPMFAPCIEKANMAEALLVNSPIDLLRTTSDHKDIPYLAMYMTREGTLRAEEAVYDGWLNKMQNNFADFLPVDLDFGDGLESRAENIRNFYFDTRIGMDSIDKYLQYHGDTMVVVPIVQGLRERVNNSVSNAWLFEFDYIGTNNSDWNLNQIPVNGTRHGSILNYLFDFDLIFDFDLKVAESFVKRIAGFAYTGNPDDRTWTRPISFTPDSHFYLSISGESDYLSARLSQLNKRNPQDVAMTFWEPLYNQYYTAPSLPSSSATVELSRLLSGLLLSYMLLLH